MNDTIIPDELIMNKILMVKGMKVMIHSDQAELYGVTTKRLNEENPLTLTTCFRISLTSSSY